DKFIRFAASYENPQPFTVIRASQLYQWIEAGEYQRLLNSAAATIKNVSDQGVCPACGLPIEPKDLFCTECGAKLEQEQEAIG
ncbi:MAG: zinc-ribbon domain-containing protein, partial [Bacteroidia bacterium]|nr:zinc-ribbon domain-containing protein [Bacteroidia bacterium]